MSGEVGNGQPGELTLLVRGGTVVTATDVFVGDVGVRHGMIAEIGTRLDAGRADEVIEAGGLLVLPGVVDTDAHVQFVVDGDASADDFASGSRAAAFGGVTTMVDTAPQQAGESLMGALEQRLKAAAGRFCVDFAFHAALGDPRDDVLQEMASAVGRGVPSFKVSTAGHGETAMAGDGEILALLERARTCGALVGVHAENQHLVEYFRKRMGEGPAWHARSRPPFVEAEAVRRAIFYTELVGGRLYLFHLSTAEGARAVGKAKGRGQMVFAETCPQYLLLRDDLYRVPDGGLYLTTPPLRGEADAEGLWRGIATGAVQVVSSGHRAFRRAQKAAGERAGLPGVETLLPLMFSEGVVKGRISLNQLVELLCANPARLFGLHPYKGNLAPGAHADLVLLDPGKKVRVGHDALHMASDWSPFEGWLVEGWPQTTILRGKPVVREGAFVGAAGEGQFLARSYGEPIAETPVAATL
ncbi:MAG: dihydropyrimidinase [Armatimonadetes bacterium]|nr:dihydropyrimidinase [Armatimonadota bacterium]